LYEVLGSIALLFLKIARGLNRYGHCRTGAQ
jgi:hypothetical protein